MTQAWLYDGHSGLRHSVKVEPQGRCLQLVHDGEPLEGVPVEQLSVLDRSAAGLTLGREAAPGWRLKLLAPPPEIAALFPAKASYGGWIDRIGLWRATALFASLSAAVIGIGYLAPSALAPLVPASVEKAYGDALVGDFGGKYCASPIGSAALQRLASRLDGKAGDLNIRVVDLPIVNAAALPAGNIVLFDKLFETVDGPDELAGILAHEIAHVRRRHVTAAMIREFGIGIFAAALGGTTGGQVDGFVALSFTRRAEREADAEAIAMLKRAGISPRPTAAFFKRLGKAEKELDRFGPALAYMSSHPLSAEREKLFSDAAKGGRYTPALSSREWTELRAICSTRPPSA
jgi:Zn-dependent protease with chaperone function